MGRIFTITINEEALHLYASARRTIVVREIDDIKIAVTLKEGEDLPEVYFEDYRCNLSPVVGANSLLYETPSSRYFSESFGYAAIRIEFADEKEVILFDVRAKKTSVAQARKMIEYLASHSEKLVKNCFSRSSITVGNERSESIDSETLLSAAERFIETLQSHQLELLNNLRERLVPVRLPLWHADVANSEIDPIDVINNLDALTPSSSGGDVFLRGRNFDLAGIYVSSVRPTANVIENQVILGGLYSVRRQVIQLEEQLRSFDILALEGTDGYESFSRLMLSLTAGGMIKRCRDVVRTVDGFIKLLERRFSVDFRGEIFPLMTPYARRTRVYRMLYSHLNDWYQLGTPSIDGMRFLMKLKSLSKIYELFVLFHTIEEICRLGWSIDGAKAHATMEDYAPSEVRFSQGDDKLTLEYEPIIGMWTPTTKHMDLIDVGHNANAQYPYWNPDFVIRSEVKGEVRYIILDAKYSTKGSVKEHHIPALFDKYYVATAAFDSIAMIATHEPIVGIFAVFSLDDRGSNYVSKWGRHGINQGVPRVPMVGGIGLMVDNSDIFRNTLSQAFNILRRTSRRPLLQSAS